MTALPIHIARCNGVAQRLSCTLCWRRTAERNEATHTMKPPEFVNGRCPARMEPR